MAIVRCEMHPVDTRRAVNRYVKRAKPVGYPNTAAICGRTYCEEPGFVWLTEEELQQFRNGECYFSPRTQIVKIQVTDDLLELPEEYLKAIKR